MKFTVLGGNGFIGSHLTNHLKSKGYETEVPSRDISLLDGKNLGKVIYAIGLTGNFRKEPYKTIEAHVSLLSHIMQNTKFDSLTYLSSTRIYGGLELEQVDEDTKLKVIPNADSLYDLSKMLGEALCLQSNNPEIKVVRLSNVYGQGMSLSTFLGSVILDAKKNKKVSINESPNSCKDYISVQDAVEMIEKITISGKNKVYNVASGMNINHLDLANKFKSLGYELNFTENSPTRRFPQISIKKFQQEFPIKTKSLLDELNSLINSF